MRPENMQNENFMLRPQIVKRPKNRKSELKFPRSCRGRLLTEWTSSSKVKVCFYIAQYPVCWSAQNALHFTPWQTCSFGHQLDFSQQSAHILCIVAKCLQVSKNVTIVFDCFSQNNTPQCTDTELYYSFVWSAVAQW